MIDFENKILLKLKQNPDYAEKVSPLLLDGEEVLDSYDRARGPS